ncbi:beta-alanine-activating enzyme isoform X3 [Piliocolobus tephrosceles]|uniref:beta-alanine-activating enzyme isoform X3 n=1 Tax=Piliocolobus tephrosceles TaxID=591936 RepID=UPI000C2AFBC0|nr:beta-alanine-activating enzyme isoform X3 [Piliocolobus tephrosceles]
MTLQDLVRKAASCYMDKVAVCFDECNNQLPVYYTYKTVVNAASELSNFLLLHCDFQGIREIGLYCQPGIDLPSWILGILQVPAAYVPIDPDSPPSLSTHFMKKCNLKYILVEKKQINKFKSFHETLLSCDTFTVEHNDLVLFRLHWKNTEVNLMLSDEKEKYEKEKIKISESSEHVNEEKAEHVDLRLKHCLAYVLHTSGTTGIPKIVRVPHECIVPNIQHFQCELPVQLGFPLLGTVVEVRDTNGFTIQEGSGQVFLGGRNRVCFLNDEVTVPLGTMRATGDFVTVKDGEIFFLGRKDSQIKRHGKRLNIELVQQVAEELQQVESCAVTWYNQEKLILFMVSKDASVKEYIFKELQKYLPSHAIPDELVLIDSLPFTSHGKIDVSELNKIYLNYINLKSENKLSGKEDLWEKLQYLWKSTLNLPEDLLKVPDESLFLNSGGDSLKSIRLLSEIEKLVGTSVPGLLEIILSSSILEIYNHILQTVFPDEDVTFRKSCATKRKLSDINQEEASGTSLHQKAIVTLSCHNEINAFVALSRGSQILSLNTTRFSTKLGHCSSAYPSDSISQTNIQNVKDLNSPVLIGKSKDPSYVVKVSEEGKPAIGTQKMELHVRWRSDTGKCVDASPLVVIPTFDKSSTTVYIGSHSHRMKAVDFYSGKVKWEQLLGDRIESSACVSKCGNFIVVGCYNGLVYVLKSNSGEKYWMFTTGDAVKSSATMDPTTGLIYIGSHDQHAYALDIYRKKCVWKSKCGGTVFSSPCLNPIPHHLYFATLGGLLLAVNPATGNIIWKHSCGKPLFSSPRCCSQYICIGCVDGNLLCFTHFGEQVWQFCTSGPIFSSPCTSPSEQKIFFGSHDRFIYCCNMKGHLQWKFETTSRVYATPFAFHNCNGSNEMLLAAASTDGKLWILESQSGQLQSVYELPGEVFSSPVVLESMLIIGCRDNYVYCLDLLGGNKK